MRSASPDLKEQEYLRNPFLLTLGERREGYKYYELLVVVPNVVGVLSTITGKLAEAKVNILTGMHTRIGEKGVWVSFIEVPDAVSIEKTIKEISSLNVVLELKYQRMDRAERFDKFLFPLSVFDRRMIVLTDYMFYSLKTALIDVLKSGGETILYMQGQSLGEVVINFLKERFKEETASIEDALHLVAEAFRAFGWGIITFQGLGPKTKEGSIIVRECIECRESSKVKCHFIRGMLVGVLRSIFQDETINVTEIKCRSTGDPYCEYQLV